MYTSKLINILKVLDRKEKEALKKWVQSPVHLQHQKSKQLLLLLLSKRVLSTTSCNRQQVYQQLFPQKEYQEASLNHVMNYCIQTVEEFIDFLSHKKDTFSNKKNVLLFFDKHGLDKYTQQSIKKIEASQKKASYHNSHYYYQQYELEKIVFDQEKKSTRIKQTNLQNIFDNHYLAFVLDSLHYASHALIHQRLYKSNYNVPLLESILEEIKMGKFKDVIAVQLYYYSYMSLRYSEEERYFQIFQDLLMANHHVLSPKEIKSIYLTAINYCIQKLNNGLEKYVRAVFELYQYGLDYNILIEEAILSHFTYKNISTAGIRLEEYEWVENFIETYTPLLAPIYQNNYSRYVKAKLSYAKKDYDTCMQLLVQVEFDDLFLNLSSKALLLKIYYEREYIDVLEALLVSFKRFLQRKSIIAYQRAIYENMISLTEKLLAIPPHDKKKKKQLRKEIENTNPLTEKPWLLEQLNKIN